MWGGEEGESGEKGSGTGKTGVSSEGAGSRFFLVGRSIEENRRRKRINCKEKKGPESFSSLRERYHSCQKKIDKNRQKETIKQTPTSPGPARGSHRVSVGAPALLISIYADS